MVYIKKGVVTDDYVNEIEHRIYNNIPITNFLEEVLPPIEIDLSLVKKMFKKGEKSVIFGEGYEHVIVTSLGRLINGETLKQYTPKQGKTKLHLYLSINGAVANTNVDLETVFKENGWPYSYKKILKTYKKYGWTLTQISY